MIKFLKKHKLKFITSLFCSFALSVFTILSFGCKTYAYTIDNNGNLVGDNLLNIDNYVFIENARISNNYIYFETPNNTSGDVRIGLGNRSSILSWLIIGQNGSGSQSVTFNIDSNLYKLYFRFNGNSQDANVYYLLDTFPNGTYTLSYECNFSATNTVLMKVMLNEGSTAKDWEPYGVWYSENNYNAVVSDNEELQEQINNRDIKNLLSGIKVNLEETNLRIYNSTNLSLSQMLGSTPFHVEMISFNTNDYNYDMQKCNIDTYNAIMNNSGEFSNGDTLTNDPTLLYTFKTPLLVDSLTFSRNSTEGTRYINLYFSDNTSTELILSEGSENNRLDITWVNSENKYIQYISTTAEINFNAVVFFSIPNGSQIYSSGYANGYIDGMYEQYQNDASAIQNANQEKQAMYNSGYAKGYQEALSKNDVGWQSLFFAMADTPIRVVSNVLGFELFGLNLFSTFIGMVTVFAIVWLLKKFI